MVIMTERLLQYIWQFQHFNNRGLITQSGDPLIILHPGKLNREQGPDFSGARVRIGSTTWAGAIELHTCTSGWHRHKHSDDPNYRNVILHVVWEDDGATVDGLPLLELRPRVSKLLLGRYEELMNSAGQIPCGQQIQLPGALRWKCWKDRLAAERLTRRAGVAESFLVENNYHWEETFWWMLARSFGMDANTEAFESVARSLPVSLLARHRDQPRQVEALLLGQGGLLTEGLSLFNSQDEYLHVLRREFRFLKTKYRLKPVHARIKFFRMRPGNFPTIRLAQLAALIARSAGLFSQVLVMQTVREIRALLEASPDNYWEQHYHPGVAARFRKKGIGTGMVNNILINTICPLLFAYGKYHEKTSCIEKALTWLQELPPETNHITRCFEQLGIENKCAFDSQALIELKKEYCDHKRCLECAVGASILKADDKRIAD